MKSSSLWFDIVPQYCLQVAFVEQLGIPLPAGPWLLAAGALAAVGRINWLAALAATTFSSLLANLIWFYLGRYGGHRVLNLLCRISLEPDSCVRRTQDVFTRYGMRGVVVAKFIPGLSTLAPPLAGSSGVRLANEPFSPHVVVKVRFHAIHSN